MPNVIDGASDFFYELLGPVNGKHARTAIGVAELPHGIPVEINGDVRGQVMAQQHLPGQSGSAACPG